MITDAEIRHTKDGQGTYMRLALDVQGGQYQGRKIFHNLTRENRNNVAKEIGERQLSQICHAIGVLEPKEKEDILFKPLVAVLKIRKGNEGYSDSNEVQRFQTLANSNGVPSFSTLSSIIVLLVPLVTLSSFVMVIGFFFLNFSLDFFLVKVFLLEKAFLEKSLFEVIIYNM